MATEKNYFTDLYEIDVKQWVEQKNGLNYLSWANAWSELKKHHPTANYTIYESQEGRPYFTDGRTCWVKTGVTVNDIEHIEYLPIKDYSNRSIPLEKITSMDMNTAIQRSLTKACARHGLGLRVYEGEDLPDHSGQNTQDLSEEEQQEQMKTLYEMVLPTILKAKTRAEVMDLKVQNAALHNYQPFKDAINKRYKEVK